MCSPFSIETKTPQINTATRALQFSYTHVTLDNLAWKNNFLLMFRIKNKGSVYDTASAQVIQVVNLNVSPGIIPT